MAFTGRLSYHTKLFFLLLGFSWLMVVCFVAFQYDREKQFKADKLNGQLQMYNSYILNSLAAGDSITDILSGAVAPMDSMRVSLISLSGQVLYDSSTDTLPTENHLDRMEVYNAVRYGQGFTLRRYSETTHDTYFYSATLGDSLIVRSAVPYSLPLRDVLNADTTFLWFMLFVTLSISVLAWFATRRIGKTISRLNDFAESAERGDKIYDNRPFPNDELGAISRHIIRLYVRLQRTTDDLAREHKSAIHQEQEKIRIKKQLTNNINHELKTPVSSIQVCLETLINHPDLTAEQRANFLNRCYSNTERLRSLLVDVSTITRLDDGSQYFEKERVVICDVVSEIATDMELSLQKKGITLDVRLPQLIVINGNPGLISSIFRNLIENAIAYSGGSVVRISLFEETDEKYIFSVSDDGVGIPEEHLPHIFERFYRIDKGRSRNAGGTGLGLSIVKNAVLFHGGTITAINRPSGGLEFVFSMKKE